MQEKSKQSNQTVPALELALLHPKRLEILGYLVQKGTATDEEELAEALDLGAALVRYHLSVLRHCDFGGSLTPSG
jgi:DNA-binding transcriptional ArsR family regulator